MKKLFNQNGFTLIEIIITLAILGILASIAIMVYNNSTEQANKVACDSNRKMIETSENLYLLKYGRHTPEYINSEHIDVNSAIVDEYISDKVNDYRCPLDGTPYYWSVADANGVKHLICNNHIDIYTTLIGSIHTYLDIWLNDYNVEVSDTGTKYNDLIDLNKIAGYTPGTKFRAGKGEDVVIGTDDNDVIFGNKGNDLIDGGAGDDKLVGNRDSDILLGGEGNDKLYGGNNDDVLYGGPGNDLINGGNGSNDVAIYEGSINDYKIKKQGSTYKITNIADGSVDTVKNIEVIKFEDDSEISPADWANQ